MRNLYSSTMPLALSYVAKAYELNYYIIQCEISVLITL